MRRWVFWCTAVLGALLAAIAIPLAIKFVNLEEGQPFALLMTHNHSVNPEAYHSRYRGAEYAGNKQQFFQWWNFLIYDTETHDHWTIVYSLEDYPDGAKVKDSATVGMVHYVEDQRLETATEKFRLDQVAIENDFSLRYRNEEKGLVPHTLTVLGDHMYRIRGSFPEKDIEWDFVVHRIHGYYGSEDSEASNIDGLCTMLSTLFAYNSEVEGTITQRGMEFKVTRSKRFRAYAAGSFGCHMPQGIEGSDPKDYPWSWMWLVVPNEDVQKDIGIVFGTGRFGIGFPLYDVYGGYGAVGLPGNKHISGRFAKMFHNTSFEVPVQSSASDGILRHLDVKRSQWTEFVDDIGSAMIPLRQEFSMITRHYSVLVDFHSTVNQYFRLPAVVVSDDGTVNVFSDFRAVGVRAHVVVEETSTATVVYDDWTSVANAVEYAYEAPLDEELLQKFLNTV